MYRKLQVSDELKFMYVPSDANCTTEPKLVIWPFNPVEIHRRYNVQILSSWKSQAKELPEFNMTVYSLNCRYRSRDGLMRTDRVRQNHKTAFMGNIFE